jgi:hypothetical protein
MTNDEQLQLWVDGNPTHMGERGDPQSQCCPDFSCCEPDMLQPVEVRKAFQAASEKERFRLFIEMEGEYLDGCVTNMNRRARKDGEMAVVRLAEGMRGARIVTIQDPRCAGCQRRLAEGTDTNWCGSECACLGAVWCKECWNQHVDRTLLAVGKVEK